jgi:hypothetical protein
MRAARGVLLVGMVMGGLGAGVGHAFRISTTFTQACHEAVTADAMTESSIDRPDAPMSEVDELLALDVPFDLPDGVDAFELSTLIGVRSNDVRDFDPFDLASLVHIHNDPDDQPAHCIRRHEDDGDAGDVSALVACRDFVVAELEQGGWFEPEIPWAERERVGIWLTFRGRADVDVVRPAYRLGRALHAVEDSYTHTFRNPEDGRVRHVLNWIDRARSDDYSLAVDGHEHVTALDDCWGSASKDQRRQIAIDGARRLIDALALASPAERRTAVDEALAASFATEAGCTADNGYCAAQEPFESPAGCSTGRRRRSGGVAAVIALLVVGHLFRRRADRVAVRRARWRTIGGVAAAVAIGSASIASAEPRAGDRNARPWAAVGSVGAAIDRAAGAISLGGRKHGLGRWGVGVDAEWNPFYSTTTGRTAPGTFNLFALALFTWHETPTYQLRSTAHVGMSILLFELIGVDKGATGLYLGTSLLGVSIRLDDRWHWLIEPSQFAMPMPQLTGFPYYYRQYRITTGLEYRF